MPVSASLFFLLLQAVFLAGLSEGLRACGSDPLAIGSVLEGDQGFFGANPSPCRENLSGVFLANAAMGDSGEEPGGKGSAFGLMPPSGMHAEEFEEEKQEDAPAVFVAVEEPKKPEPPKTASKKPGSGIFIPENPTDLSFMEGCWKSISPISSYATKLPIVYHYCFDKNGNAKVYLEEMDKDGNVTDTACRGIGFASISGGKISILDKGVDCDKGNSYSQVSIECSRGQDGMAQCHVVPHSDLVKPFDARLAYTGKSYP
jgi:hypothetical protein